MADPADTVDTVVRALITASVWALPCQEYDALDENAGEDYREVAGILLAALAEHGALMPTGGETREEWAVTYLAHGVQVLWSDPVDDRADAERSLREAKAAVRGDGQPRWANPLLERRTVTTTYPEGHPLAGHTLTSPWGPVDG